MGCIDDVYWWGVLIKQTIYPHMSTHNLHTQTPFHTHTYAPFHAYPSTHTPPPIPTPPTGAGAQPDIYVVDAQHNTHSPQCSFVSTRPQCCYYEEMHCVSCGICCAGVYDWYVWGGVKVCVERCAQLGVGGVGWAGGVYLHIYILPCTPST